MNKTFKSTNVTDAPIHHLTVGASDGEVLMQVHYGESLKGVLLATADALDVALAIIDEAYPPADYVLDGSPEAFLAVAREYLGKASRTIESKAKEAADREGLEAEAWELFRVWNPFTKYGGLTSLPDFLRAEWVAVALKAREIHKAVS